MGHWAGFCLRVFLSVKISIKGKENIIGDQKIKSFWMMMMMIIIILNGQQRWHLFRVARFASHPSKPDTARPIDSSIWINGLD